MVIFNGALFRFFFFKVTVLWGLIGLRQRGFYLLFTDRVKVLMRLTLVVNSQNSPDRICWHAFAPRIQKMFNEHCSLSLKHISIPQFSDMNIALTIGHQQILHIGFHTVNRFVGAFDHKRSILEPENLLTSFSFHFPKARVVVSFFSKHAQTFKRSLNVECARTECSASQSSVVVDDFEFSA